MAVVLTAIMFLFIACNRKQEADTIDAVEDRTSIPRLDATQVTTVISDSGITRYRISTKEWLIYDKAEEPYWDFPSGIILENFDTDLNVDASIESDYAKFLENPQIWELTGNVVAINLQGEMFETEQLFWDQKAERIYSDSMITITRATSIIWGIGFESNQSMTNYTIRKPQGIFPVKEETNDSVPAGNRQPIITRSSNGSPSGQEPDAVPTANKPESVSTSPTRQQLKQATVGRE